MDFAKIIADEFDLRPGQIQAVIDLLDGGNTGRSSGLGLHDWSKIDDDDYRYRKQVPFFFSVSKWDLPG